MAGDRIYVGSGAWTGETGRIQVLDLSVDGSDASVAQDIGAGGVAAYLAWAPSGRVLYVADETLGFVRSYSVNPESGHLSLQSEKRSAGHPVYLAVSADGGTLATCFFREGQTELFELATDGSLVGSAFRADSGKESHCAVFSPRNDALFVPTRGDNWVAQFGYEPSRRALTARKPPYLEELVGAGARHLCFHPTLPVAYLTCEFSLALSVLGLQDDGTLRFLQRGVAAAPAASTGGSSADVRVHPSGRFVFVSNRQGEASNLATFAVDPATGEVQLLGHEPTRGRTPRNFCVHPSGRRVYVANRESDTLVALDFDPSTGAFTHRATHLTAPGPFFVGLAPPVAL